MVNNRKMMRNDEEKWCVRWNESSGNGGYGDGWCDQGLCEEKMMMAAGLLGLLGLFCCCVMKKNNGEGRGRWLQEERKRRRKNQRLGCYVHVANYDEIKGLGSPSYDL